MLINNMTGLLVKPSMYNQKLLAGREEEDGAVAKGASLRQYKCAPLWIPP